MQWHGKFSDDHVMLWRTDRQTAAVSPYRGLAHPHAPVALIASSLLALDPENKRIVLDPLNSASSHLVRLSIEVWS